MFKQRFFIKERFLNFGIVANSIMVLLCLIANLDFSFFLIFALCFAFFLNFIPIFIKDMQIKYQFLIDIFYLLGIFWSLIFMPSFFYFANPLDPVWAVHFCVCLIFAMILLEWYWLLIFLFLGILSGFIIGFIFDSLTYRKLIILAYETGIISCIWYFFYCLRLRSICEKQEELKNVGLGVLHELITPLSSCLMKFDALKKSNQIAYQQQNFLDLSNELEKTLKMIGILKINFNDRFFVNSNSVCDLVRVIESSIASYPFNQNESEKVVFLKNGFDKIFVKAEPKLLEYVFYNLFKNALFFIKKAGKGEIIISFCVTDNFVCLDFQDTGYGIKPCDKNKVFDKFFSRRKLGTGMGLYFCKNVINSFGGYISCSTKFKSYTKFTIKLKIDKGVEHDTKTISA